MHSFQLSGFTVEGSNTDVRRDKLVHLKLAKRRNTAVFVSCLRFSLQFISGEFRRYQKALHLSDLQVLRGICRGTCRLEPIRHRALVLEILLIAYAQHMFTLKVNGLVALVSNL